MALEGKSMICSFCGALPSEVGALIAGPVCFICDDCVRTCVSIVAEKMRVNKTETSEEKS